MSRPLVAMAADGPPPAWAGLDVGNDGALLGGSPVDLRRSLEPAASLMWELELLVALDEAGFVVPVPIATDLGELSVDGWIVQRPVAGSAPTSPDDWVRVVAEVRRLGGWGHGRRQRPGSSTVATIGGEAGDRYLESHHTLINGNLDGSNVRLQDDGWVAFLDWSRSRIDAPDLDLVRTPQPVLPAHRSAVAAAADHALVGDASAGPGPRIGAWPHPVRSDGTVQVRPRTVDDVDAQLAGEDDEFIRRLSGGAPTRPRVAEHITNTARLWEVGGLRLDWGIRDVDGDVLAGTIGVNLADPTLDVDEVNVSYGLFPEWRGRGFATSALTLVLDYLAEQPQLADVRPVLKIEASNPASIAVAERCGFSDTGPLHGTLHRHTLHSAW